ncbi:MAG TPA: twin-arginine translocase subunit TatC [Rhodothermales bacterium]|nr:twin-arginine translocase subunit TatC [Rhodothermales bacterium]
MNLFKFRTPPALRQLPSGAQGDGAAAAPEGEMAEMSFLDHLEELRWTILKSMLGLLLTTVVCSFFAKWVIDVLLLGPVHSSFFMYKVLGLHATDVVLQNRDITGQFFAYWGTVLAVGLVVGSPIIVYQLWKFIEPGLYPSEKKGLRFASFGATFFFVLGLSFGYLVLTPVALMFFQNFRISDNIINQFDISRYFSMVTTWVFGSGIIFELPVVVYFLAKLGLVNAALMRKVRSYAAIVILIIAAIVTPPDVISQTLVAIPLLALYELSIFIAATVEKNRKKLLEELAKADSPST